MQHGMRPRASLKKCAACKDAWIAVWMERYIVAQGNSVDDVLT